MKYKKCLFLVVIIIAVGAWVLFGRRALKPEIRNVLLISIDTLRSDYLSCYGYRQQTTPNIDSIAKKGILFENVYSPVPLTLPAHSSMLTGTIPPNHSTHDNMDYRLGQHNITLAEIFKKNGFATGAVISAFVLDSQFGFDQGFDSFNDKFEEESFSSHISERKGDEATRIAIEWLEKHKEKPFFYFLHYYDPHSPYEPPEPFASRFPNSQYAGEIAFTDNCIGRIVEKLKELKLYNSTLIVITGDHGEMLNEHGEIVHGYFIYESALRVPLIFKLPGQQKAKRLKKITGLVDIAPTVCGLLRIENQLQMQGKDLSDYFWNSKPDSEEGRYIYCESLTPTKYGANTLLGVITDRYKYIQTTRSELYDIVNDPTESNNLIGAQPNRGRIMQDELGLILKNQLRKDDSDSKFKLDEQGRERLESLGYIASSDVSEDFEFDQDKEDPKDLIDFHILSGKVVRFIFEKKYTQAKNLCLEMLSERPDYIDGFVHLADVAKKQGDYAGAIPYLQRAVELGSRRYEVYNGLGVAFANLDDFESAAKHFEEALGIWPDQPEVLTNLGISLFHQEKTDQAAKYCRKAIEIDPKMAGAHYNLGLILSSQGKVSETIALYSEAIRLAPEMHAAHNSLAEIYFAQEKFAQALDHWTWVLEIMPDNINVLNNMAWVKSAYENESFYNPSEAIELAQKACELAEFKRPDLLDTLSVAYATAGKFDESVEIAQKALDLALSFEQNDLAEEIQKRLELYKAGKSYEEILQK